MAVLKKLLQGTWYLMVLAGLQGAALADSTEPRVLEILYDVGNPLRSVAVIEGGFLEFDDLYANNFRIIHFEPDAVIARDQTTQDTLRWEPGDAGIDENLLQRGRHLFAVKQMKAIYEAQVRRVSEKFVFAPSLDALVQEGYLADGFEQGRKSEYTYQILEAAERRGTGPHYKEEPYFKAVAEPGRNGDYYFMVDELGQVRFAPNLEAALKGPVWDYADHSRVSSTDITVTED